MTACSCGSGKPVVAWGLCSTCYQRERRAGRNPRRKPRGKCVICGMPHRAKGLCGAHYMKSMREPT